MKKFMFLLLKSKEVCLIDLNYYQKQLCYFWDLNSMQRV